MMGSDFPYFQDEKYTRAVTYIQDSGIDPAKVDGILYGNAVKFFEIEHE